MVIPKLADTNLKLPRNCQAHMAAGFNRLGVMYITEGRFDDATRTLRRVLYESERQRALSNAPDIGVTYQPLP